MSIQAVSWVLTHSQAKLGARLVLMSIANHADAIGEHAYPPVAMIAAEAGMSERQAQRCIATLKRIGELEVAGVGGRGRSNAFRLIKMGDKLSPFNGVDTTAKGDISGIEKGDIIDTHSAERVTFSAQKGDISGQKGCQKCHPNLKRTLREDSDASHLPPAKVPPAAEPDPVGEIFDRGLRLLGGKRRSLLGKLRKEHGDEVVLAAIIATEAECPSEPVAFLIGCLARAGPKTRGKHPGTYRPGAGAALFEGGYLAAQSYIERHQLDYPTGDAAALPLLDGKRSGGDAPGADRGLAGGHGRIPAESG